ncbi:hypothetical protein N7470_008034 [Penicillium chermesinum]|nr:hypothetical protein N7470_008034 [Penicillium chermesinum]
MTPQSVLVIGGSGAQGIPIVKELSRSDNYHAIRVLTRDPTSDNCRALASLPKVTLYPGSADDEPALRRALAGVDLAFVNTNSWSLGIKGEIYWGIRIYELAVQAGVKHFIWSSLDNFAVETRFDEELRREDSTRWSILTTGPYIEMLSELLRPTTDEHGTYCFDAPLGQGAVPFVHLDDLGYYVDWIFSHIDESAGMNLKVAVEHVSYSHLATTFTKVTGKPAQYRDITFEETFTKGPLSPVADVKIGAETAGDDPTLLSYRENFTAWWKLYARSADNKGILQRDYELLDRIFPERVRSLEQWMHKVGYTGEPKPVLKHHGAR